MLSFKEYLTQEYREKAKGFAAVEIKFNHTYNIKTDSKSSRPRRNDLIKVSLKFVDKDLNALYSASIVFENNMIPKRLHKSFVNISPKELENRFAVAKNEIRDIIANEYLSKINEFNNKLTNLNKYLGTSRSVVIPQEFNGESINISENNDSKKTYFEM